MNTSRRRRDSQEEAEALGRAAAANVAPSGPDARLGHPPTTYIARYVPPMMARVTHGGNIVPNSQRYLQFLRFKIAVGNPTNMHIDFTVTVDVLVEISCLLKK